MRAVIYTRLSRDRADETSTQRQEADCRALCAAKRYDVTAVHTDLLSGYKTGVRRPGYDQAIAAVRAGDVDALVVWKLDRLTRQGVREIGVVLDALDAGGAKLISVMDSIDTSTAMGEGVLALLGSIAKQESESISSRTSRAKLDHAARGGVGGGGRRPYGYSEDRLHIEAAEADLIREAARRVVNGEHTYSIVADWNRRGVPTATGGAWRPQTLNLILRSSRVRGLRSHRGVVVGPASWPAILDAGIARQVDIALARTPTGRHPRVNLLAGLVVCGRCETPLLSRRRYPGGSRCYACVRLPGLANCGRLSTSAQPVEDLVAQRLILRLDAGFVQASVRDDPEPSGTVEDEALLAQLAADYGSRLISREEWLSARSPVDARLAAARRAMAARPRSTILNHWLHRPGGLPRWPELAWHVQRGIIESVVRRVVIAPTARRGPGFDRSRVTVEWVT